MILQARHRYRCDSGSGFAIPKSPPRRNDKDLEHPIAAAVAHVGAVPQVPIWVEAKRHLGCRSNPQFASPRVGLECCGIQAAGCNGTMPQFHAGSTTCTVCMRGCCCVAALKAAHLPPWHYCIVRGIKLTSSRRAAMRTSLEFASRLNRLPHAISDDD